MVVGRLPRATALLGPLGPDDRTGLCWAAALLGPADAIVLMAEEIVLMAAEEMVVAMAIMSI